MDLHVYEQSGVCSTQVEWNSIRTLLGLSNILLIALILKDKAMTEKYGHNFIKMETKQILLSCNMILKGYSNAVVQSICVSVTLWPTEDTFLIVVFSNLADMLNVTRGSTLLIF